MSDENLSDLGKAFVELGQLLQDKQSTVSQLAEAAEKCGIRLGLAILSNKELTPGMEIEE